MDRSLLHCHKKKSLPSKNWKADKEEVLKVTKSLLTGQGIPNNKLIKSYKRSSNANNKNDKTQNQIKNNQ